MHSLQIALVVMIFPAVLVAFIQDRIDQARSGLTPPISAFRDVMDRFFKDGIATKQCVHPSKFLVHPANRGGLGVNAFNVHRVGAQIVRLGVEPQELQKGVAFERQPTEPGHSQQHNFNCRLIDSSKKYLAPVNGSERYVTVGTGHTVQFFRSVLAGCPTPEASLRDQAGNLNAQTLSDRDPRFAEALKGWEWTILPWQAEVTWPQLPDLAQRALNATNNVASLMSELEVCVTIAEFAELRSSDSSFEACVDAVALNEPPCKDPGDGIVPKEMHVAHVGR